jgi:YVTN family beta-propeller protein
MRTTSRLKKIHRGPSLWRMRIAAAGLLVLAGAALAYIGTAPTLPWAVPMVNVGNDPVASVVDQATHTVYVDNAGDDTVSVIDGTKCNSGKTSGCSPIATLTVGPNPLFMAFDPTTGTLYVVIAGGNSNTIAVVNANTCNAKKTSGCGQTPAVVTISGSLFPTLNPDTGNIANIALDTAIHTLYIGDGNEGPVAFLNTATCNGTNTSGCSQTPPTTATNGDSIGIDHTNHSVYVTDAPGQTLSVFNGSTCNASTQSNCAPSATISLPLFSYAAAAVEETTHTVYVPQGAIPEQGVALEYVAMLNGSTCNGTVTSGCGNTLPTVQVGGNPETPVIDPATKTVYVGSEGSSKVSVINAATCNATNQSGCTPTPLPAIAQGNGAGFPDIDLKTHTLYAPSQALNNVWVLNGATCNATQTSGCTKFAPVTAIGPAPGGVTANPNTKTVYAANQADNTVSVIDTTVCNSKHLAGCSQSWPTIAVGNNPRFIGINKITNTIYVSNLLDGTLSVVNAATCNGSTTSGCVQLATTRVGNGPEQIAVDEATNTIYVVNQDDGTVSVINGAVCNAANTSGCVRHWLTVTVGTDPEALGINPANHTVYVANRLDNTVSVINGNTCNGTTHSGCAQKPATIPVGSRPRAVAVDPGTNTVFVNNNRDLTVGVINGATCNGTNTSGCGQVPPAVIVSAFPSAAGIGPNTLGRNIVIDPATHKVYITKQSEDDISVIDGSICNGSNTSSCQASTVPLRMGGGSFTAALDDSSGTIYVGNDFDGTVSLFAK